MRRLSKYLDPNRRVALQVSDPGALRYRPDKGLFDGACNREACQRPGAVWFNRETRAYYCRDCAHLLNRSNADWANDKTGGPLCSIVTAEEAKHV